MSFGSDIDKPGGAADFGGASGSPEGGTSGYDGGGFGLGGNVGNISGAGATAALSSNVEALQESAPGISDPDFNFADWFGGLGRNDPTFATDIIGAAVPGLGMLMAGGNYMRDLAKEYDVDVTDVDTSFEGDVGGDKRLSTESAYGNYLKRPFQKTPRSAPLSEQQTFTTWAEWGANQKQALA